MGRVRELSRPVLPRRETPGQRAAPRHQPGPKEEEMTPQLRVNLSLERLDPNALIEPERWEEFTKLYVQGIRIAVWKTFPGLELDVNPAQPGDQEDRVECFCRHFQTCDHEEALHWLGQDDNWLQRLDHAIREMGSRPPAH